MLEKKYETKQLTFECINCKRSHNLKTTLAVSYDNFEVICPTCKEMYRINQIILAAGIENWGKVRPCLCCDKKFVSMHRRNRTCYSCRTISLPSKECMSGF